MKKISFCLSSIVIGIIFDSCQFVTSEPIECPWSNDVTVTLEDHYLALPCDDSGIKYHELSFLEHFFGFGEIYLYDIMTFPQYGTCDSCSLDWRVTDTFHHCTERSGTRIWHCDNSQHSLLSTSQNSFREVPRPDGGYNSMTCKYHYELKIAFSSDLVLVWEQDWPGIVPPDDMNYDGTEQTFHVSSYDAPIIPRVVSRTNYNRIYINNQFQ